MRITRGAAALEAGKISQERAANEMGQMLSALAAADAAARASMSARIPISEPYE